MICENHQSLKDWENLLLLSLEIGFRHLNPEHLWISAKLTHTEHHQKLVDVVFRSRDREAIADLLHAWTLREGPHDRLDALLSMCARHLVGFDCLVPFSPRLHKLVIRTIEAIGYQGFEEVGAESFVGLLNHLNVSVEDMEYEYKWILLLLDTIQYSEGAQHLSHQSWKFLVEYTILEWWRLGHISYRSHITLSLEKAQEWDRLECWMGVVWMAWPPEADDSATIEELEHVMISLFKQQPNAAQKLEQWMKQWSQECNEEIPETFYQVYKQAYEAVQWNAL